MKKKPFVKIGIDLDGVLVDWDAGWVQLIENLHGKILTLPRDGPAIWHWDTDMGLTRDEHAACWAYVGRHPNWWLSLQPTQSALFALPTINTLTVQNKLDPYFITARRGLAAKQMSVRWLQQWGIFNPHVLQADSFEGKAMIAKGLNLDLFVEDRLENAVAVAGAGVKTLVVRRPYNEALPAHPNLSHCMHVYAALAVVGHFLQEEVL